MHGPHLFRYQMLLMDIPIIMILLMSLRRYIMVFSVLVLLRLMIWNILRKELGESCINSIWEKF